MKRISKKKLRACIWELDLLIQEYDPTLATLIKTSQETSSLSDEILAAYCSSRSIPKSKFNKLISKVEELLKLLKDTSGGDSTQS